jgi:hypothetical protein
MAYGDDSFKTTEVDSRGRAVYKDRGSNTYFTLDPKTGAKIKGGSAPAPVVNNSASTPSSFQSETPAGNISQPSGKAQYLPQFTLALQQAMDSAGKHRQASLIGLGLDAVGGEALAPGTSGGVVDMIRRSVGPEVSALFGGAVQSVSASIQAEAEERAFQFKIQESQRALVSDLARDGALMQMNTESLARLGESAGISSEILISWKARLQEADELEKSDAELKRRQIETDIANTLDTIRERQEPDKGDGAGTNEAAVELMSKDAFIRREQEQRQQTLSPTEANRLYEDYVANNSVSGNEAELIQLALDGLTEEGRQAYNLLGTKEAKEQLVLRGLGIKSGVTSSKPISQSGRTP